MNLNLFCLNFPIFFLNFPILAETDGDRDKSSDRGRRPPIWMICSKLFLFLNKTIPMPTSDLLDSFPQSLSRFFSHNTINCFILVAPPPLSSRDCDDLEVESLSGLKRVQPGRKWGEVEEVCSASVSRRGRRPPPSPPTPFTCLKPPSLYFVAERQPGKAMFLSRDWAVNIVMRESVFGFLPLVGRSTGWQLSHMCGGRRSWV